MIKINLLPEEFKVKPKTTQNVPVIKIGIAVGALFALMTVVFYVDWLFAQSKLKKIEKEWAEVQPRSAILNQLQTEVDTVLKPERDFMNSYVVSSKPLTHFLSWSSEFLPESVWLTEILLERKGDGGSLILRGLALPIKEKSSIEQIESYLHLFQEKIPDARLSLTTTRQKLEETELTQFTANFEWGVVSA